MDDGDRERQLIRQAWADGLAPDPVILLSDWSDQNVILSETDSAEPGPWRTSRVPFAREIMDCLSPSSPIQKVVFQKATQIAGTSIGKNWIAYLMANRGGPTMYILPTTKIAKRVSKTRIAPMIEAMPCLAGKVREKRSRDSGNTIDLKEFEGGILVFAGANSAAELRSQPIKNLIGDEVDAYPLDVDDEGAPLEIAEKRLDTFSRKKKFITSSPTDTATTVIGREFEASDQRHFYVPCPHCDHAQRLQWEQMRWRLMQIEEMTCMACGAVGRPAPSCEHCGAAAGDQQINNRLTNEIEDVWYECQACNGRIEEWRKTVMLERGRWVAHAPGRDKAAGFQLSALYSPLGWFSWREAVRMYLKAEATKDKETEQVFWNTILGLPYDQPGEHVEPDNIKQRARQSDYRIGQVPTPALLLTAGVDVQADRLEVYIYGWGRGESASLIDFQVLHGETSIALKGAWLLLPDILDKGYRHASGNTIRLSSMGIDSGYQSQVVYKFVNQFRGRGVFATKGQSQPGKPVIGPAVKVHLSDKGKKAKQGLRILYPLGTENAKAIIYARLKLTAPAAAAWQFPQGLPDSVFEQLTAERCITKYVRGYPVRIWIKDKHVRNEALDCAVIAYAAAIKAGLQSLNWDRLEQLIAPAQRDMLTTPPEAPPGPADAGDDAVEASEANAPAAEAVAAETPAPAPKTSRPPAKKPQSFISRLLATRRGGRGGGR